MKIEYFEFDVLKGSVLRSGYTENMLRCYENYDSSTGEFKDFCHCGNAFKHDTCYYVCPNGGNQLKICGYLGFCGFISRPDALEDVQLSFFD